MTTSSFIPREKLKSYQRWKMDSLETFDSTQRKCETDNSEDTSTKKQTNTLPTDEEITAIVQNAKKDGYAAGFQEGSEKGYAEGRKAAEAAVKAEVVQLQTLLSDLNQDLCRLDQEVADELLSLAIALSKKMIGQALIFKPELILPIVQEAIKSLPGSAQHPRLYLHPDDVTVIHSHLDTKLAQENWSIREDDRLCRGSCRIEADGSEIDASLQVRWQRVLAAIGRSDSWLDHED